jgi:uncharacterized protein (DUF952 family)
MQSSEAVYKVFTEAEWQAFQSSGTFAGNAADISDGYIHLSKKIQLQRVIDKYYRDAGPVVVAEFADPSLLKKLKWEPASNGDLYPHLYGESLVFSGVKKFAL